MVLAALNGAAAAQSASFRSPSTPARPVIDDVHGVKLTDDYRWLETGRDPEVEAWSRRQHEATLAYVRTPVGKTSAPLYSYFALVADDPSVQIVSQAQSWYIKDMLKETQYKDLPVLSAAPSCTV